MCGYICKKNKVFLSTMMCLLLLESCGNGEVYNEVSVSKEQLVFVCGFVASVDFAMTL